LTFKLIDKSQFTIINQFNHAIRNEIKRTIRFNPHQNRHLFKTYNATVGYDEKPLYDVYLTKIAEILKLPKLNCALTLSRAIKSYKSRKQFYSAIDTPFIDKVVMNLMRTIHQCQQQAIDAVHRFVDEQKNYTLILNNGKEIKYSSDIISRTLTTFAEYHQELAEIYNKVSRSGTIEDVANALYGKYLTQLDP
jgi:hypothetical protein